MDEPRIALNRSASGIGDLSDETFLSAILWDRAAPKSLVHAARDGSVSTFSREMQRHLGTRRGGRKRILPREVRTRPALWSRPAPEDGPRAERLASLWKNFGSGKRRTGKKIHPHSRRSRSRAPSKDRNRQSSLLRKWLDSVDDHSPPSPFELSILLEILAETAPNLPADLLWRLWRTALTAAARLPHRTDHPAPDAIAPDHRLLARAELPWEAGLLFDGIRGAGKLRQTGRRQLRRRLLDGTDTDGTPSAELLECLPFWLASLIRAGLWDRRFRASLWNAETEERFRELVRTVVPLCRSDGRLALGNGSLPETVPLLMTASRLAGWQGHTPPMKALQDLRGSRRKAGKAASSRSNTLRAPWPVTQSDWSRLACLRNDWSARADTLVVAHHRETPLIDLAVLGTPVLYGPWEIELTVDGRPAEFSNDWLCSCWSSDEDADFIELHMSLPGGLQIDRQMLLSRTDHFALFSDVIAAKDDRRIDYASRLPLAGGVGAQPETRTRECRLRSPRRTARAFPLALSDDRVISAPGSFDPDPRGRLQLQQTARGGLYAPVLIDWHPRRRRSHADWRTLTVTEDGRILRSNAAAAHRVRLGAHQLLLYRSLRKTPAQRAVLGHHTLNETVIGYFDADGDVEPIIIVE